MALFKCPECGELISTESISCPKCGYNVNAYMENNGDKIQCNHCWKLNESGTKFCSHCGNNLQYSHSVKDGLPSDALKQAKIDEHERKTLPFILAIIIIVLLLMCILATSIHHCVNKSRSGATNTIASTLTI